jgi:hypothetical protein
MFLKLWFGHYVGWISWIGSKVDLDEPNFPHPTSSKPACCKTWIPWIPFPTIPNHALYVSSGLACFWSCGLVIMLVGHLELAQKLIWASQIFLIPHCPNHQQAARLRAHGFPSQPSQIMHWMYQVAWDVFESVVRSLWWLDILNWLKSWFGRAKFSSSHIIQTSLLQ